MSRNIVDRYVRYHDLSKPGGHPCEEQPYFTLFYCPLKLESQFRMQKF